MSQECLVSDEVSRLLVVVRTVRVIARASLRCPTMAVFLHDLCKFFRWWVAAVSGPLPFRSLLASQFTCLDQVACEKEASDDTDDHASHENCERA